ncbi:MAG TPA: DinB family protein [Chitinophagaceae bacterium]
MNKEVLSICKNLEKVLNGQPWFGRAMYEILGEIDEAKVYTNPNNTEHSLIELLYHVNTWAEFTLKRLEDNKEEDLAAAEKKDWREIDPAIHTWANGMAELKDIHKKILELLQTKDDTFLKEIVDYRQYNFRFLLNGLIQHNIYHLGQIAYLNKLLG